MVGLISGIIGGVGALASTIAGGITSAKRNREADDLMAQQRADNKAWWESRRMEDYTQRSDAQAVIRKQRALYDEQLKRARMAQVVSGGTDESLAMAQQAAAQGVADTMSDIAAQAAQSKDAAEAQYRAMDNSLVEQAIANKRGQASGIASAAGQAASAGMNMLGDGLNDYFKSKS